MLRSTPREKGSGLRKAARRVALGLFVLFAFALAADRSGVDVYNSGVEDGWTREYSAGQPHNVRSVPAPTRSGAEALRMEARYGEQDKDGSYHAELERALSGRPGETVWYGFSTYVPTSWVDSSQVAIVAQWWSHSRASPPLGLEIAGDDWVIFQRWAEGEDGLSKQTAGRVRKGEWTDWVVQAHWAYSDEGHLKVWRNGEAVYERRGPSVYRKTENLRFKLGVYVWPWNDNRPTPERSSPRVIYHDEVRIGFGGSSYDAVSPSN